MTLSELVEEYQAWLEGQRAHPDDEHISEQLERARRAARWKSPGSNT